MEKIKVTAQQRANEVDIPPTFRVVMVTAKGETSRDVLGWPNSSKLAKELLDAGYTVRVEPLHKTVGGAA